MDPGGGPSLDEGSVTTDAAGRFLWRLATSPEDESDRAVVLAMEEPPHGLDEVRSEPRPLAAVTEGGRYELGDFDLHVPPVTVAGLVLGSDGAPLAGARMHIQTFPRPGDSVGGGDEFRPGFQSGPDGSFRSYTKLRPDRICQVSATDPRTNVTGVAEFEPGSTQVVVRIPRSVLVRGRIALGFEPPWPALDVRLVQEDTGEVGRSFSASEEPDGSFTFPAVPEGRYRLEVSEARGFRMRLYRGEPFLLTLPGAGTEVELPTLDLRSLVKRMSVRCETGRGEPLAGVEIRRRLPGRIAHNGGTTDEDGRFTVLAPSDATPTATVSLAGIRPMTISLDADPRVVVLEPELDVPVEAPLAFDVPEPYQLGVVLLPEDEEDSSEFEGVVDENGIGVVRVPREGRYRVRLQLRIQRGAHRTSITLLGPSGEPGVDQVVEVTRNADGSVPAIRADTTLSALQQALETARRLREP